MSGPRCACYAVNGVPCRTGWVRAETRMLDGLEVLALLEHAGTFDARMIAYETLAACDSELAEDLDWSTVQDASIYVDRIEDSRFLPPHVLRAAVNTESLGSAQTGRFSVRGASSSALRAPTPLSSTDSGATK